MVQVREGVAGPSRGFRALAPVGQFLGEPRFKWAPIEAAWIYRVELTDEQGTVVATGWSGFSELPLAWLRDAVGQAPELTPGERYRWKLFAYQDRPDGPPFAAAPEAEFLFLGS